MKIRRVLICTIATSCLFSSALLLYAQSPTFSELESEEEYRYGVQSFHSGYFNDAALAFERAAAAHPDTELNRRWLGRAYAQSGYWEAALDEWAEIVEAGDATLALLQRMEIMEERSGLADLLADRKRYVTAASFSGHSPEYTLFRRPTSIRPLPNGANIVVAFGNHTVVILDANGNRRRELQGGLGGLDGPYDVLPLPNGDFFVSEFQGDRISRLNSRGDRIDSFGSRGRGEGELLGPQFLAMDPSEHLYVSDWGNRIVQKFDQDGGFLFAIGGESAGFSGLRRPTGIAWWKNALWVADAEKASIEVFDASGNHLNSYSVDEFYSPQTLAVYDDDTLMITDRNRILLYQPTTGRMDIVDDASTRRLAAAAYDANGNIVAVDHDAESMFVFTPVSQLYAGMRVTIQRITADNFPEVTVDLTVEDRAGNPVVGLDGRNFIISDPGGTLQNIDTVLLGWRSEVMHSSLVLQVLPDGLLAPAYASDLVQDVYAQRESGDTFRLVTADSNPVLEADAGVGGTTAGDRARRFIEQQQEAATGAQSGNGQPGTPPSLDTALRFAADELIQLRGRRQIVLTAAGGSSIPEFTTYDAIELLRYMQENHILFSVIRVGEGELDAKLQYLVDETDGRVIADSDPRGIAPVVDHGRQTPNGWYTLRYRSNADSDFGRRYLPISIESLLLQRAGRDELGFFAPQEF